MNETTKNSERKPPLGIEPYYVAAWRRISELAEAIIRQYESPDGDPALVEKWAQEITWQCTIIEAMKDDTEE